MGMREFEFNFFTLTDKEILQGILYVISEEHRNHSMKDDPLLAFAWDNRLRKLASMWLESEMDMNIMRLKFADEIAELQQQEYWFNYSV